jgi:2-oxoisovalerate dehydrogenase E1 component alpha subunit
MAPHDTSADGELDLGLLHRMFAEMHRARRLDESMIIWQRQGLIPAYPPSRGQEAAQVGSVLALDRDRDFVFPSYRETAVAVAWGVDLEGYLATHQALWHGGLWDPVADRFAPLQAVVGGSPLHAVGWSHGRRRDGSDAVAIVYFGDGASSQGDVHEAMNFAAIFGAPTIFFVQNNRWALSVPLEREVAGGSVAARAAGYGIPGVTIDGDDPVAVYRATRDAVERARADGTPSVIEAMTYRRGPHATSDDPGRYRSLEDERSAGPDPLDRFREVLLARGVDAAWFDELAATADHELDRLREVLESPRVMAGTDMFDHVFIEPTPQIVAQRAAWRKESTHA